MTRDRIDTVDIWEPEVPAFTDKQSYIRVNNELLIEAMQATRSCQRQKFVMLSGGEDSRRLAITARHLGMPITCITQQVIGKEASDKDALVAEAVCRSLGVPHIRVPLPSHRDVLNDAMAEDYWLGYEGGQHEWMLPLLRQVPPNALVYDGIIADVTVNGHFFHTYPQLITRFGDLDYAARLVCGTRQSGIEAKLLSSPLFERVRAELARVPGFPAPADLLFSSQPYPTVHRRLVCAVLPVRAYARAAIHLLSVLRSIALPRASPLPRGVDAKRMHEGDEPAGRGDPVDAQQSAGASCHRPKAGGAGQGTVRGASFADPPEATRYLPGLARIRRAYEAMSLLGLQDRADRWSWAPNYLTRFSRFLDWIEDRQAPPTSRSKARRPHFPGATSWLRAKRSASPHPRSSGWQICQKAAEGWEPVAGTQGAEHRPKRSLIGRDDRLAEFLLPSGNRSHRRKVAAGNDKRLDLRPVYPAEGKARIFRA